MRAALAVLIIVAALSSVRAETARPGTAYPLNDSAFSAELMGIDADWNISFQADGERRTLTPLKLAYWGGWRDIEQGARVVLADGSLIRADVLAIDEERVTLGDATGLGRGLWAKSALPRPAVKAIWFQPSTGTSDRDRQYFQLSKYDGAADRVLLADGETVDGKLVGIPDGTAEQIRFLVAGIDEPIQIASGRVTALMLAAPRTKQPGGPLVWMGFTDGSLIHALSIDRSGSIQLAAGGELRWDPAHGDSPHEVDWKSICYLEPKSDSVAWLSDFTAEYKHTPFLRIRRPLTLDQMVLGNRPRIDGCAYRKSVGMPTAGEATYDIRGYKRFESLIAVDDAAQLRGSVIFKIILKGRSGETIAFESKTLRGGDKPVPITVDLAGATQMTLHTEFAERGDECDYANWLMARLTR